MLFIVFIGLVARLYYKTGYNTGYRQACFNQKQDELEKSGRFFLSSNGVKMPIPNPPPKAP
jgi:hypothetical protein